MATRKRRSPEGAGPERLVFFATRISKKAQELLKERAQARGLRPAAWARITLYKELGLLQGSDQ